MNRNAILNHSASIEIGNNVDIGPGVALLTATHDIGTGHRRAGGGRSDPIKIGAGSWIGANATILPGVTIAPGCVVAAGALVIEDCAANGLYAGVPARRVRDLNF